MKHVLRGCAVPLMFIGLALVIALVENLDWILAGWGL